MMMAVMEMRRHPFKNMGTRKLWSTPFMPTSSDFSDTADHNLRSPNSQLIPERVHGAAEGRAFVLHWVNM
jgi:hypothetical protein